MNVDGQTVNYRMSYGGDDSGLIRNFGADLFTVDAVIIYGKKMFYI
jgi:hypothetical protein